MSLKKIIILGAGHEQTPAIKLCKKLNIKTIVCDKNSNAYGKKYSDIFYPYNITNFKKILGIAKKFKVDGIFTLCSEVAVPIVSRVSSILNLQNISELTSKLSTNKVEMKKTFQSQNIDTPKFDVISNLSGYHRFKKLNKLPLVLKPTDSSGQNGVFLIKKEKDLKNKINFIKKISSDKKIIIEKYYHGYEINVVALIENSKIEFLSISHRKTFPNRNFGIAVSHTYPTNLTKEELKKVKKISEKAIRSLGMVNGIAYPQVMMTSNRKFKMIEIASRIPGGFMREMALLVSGIDPIEFSVKKIIGEKNVLKNMRRLKRKKAVFIKFFTKLNFLDKKRIKKVIGINNAKKTRGIYDIFIRKISSIPELNKSSDRFGAMITYGNNINDAKKNCQRARKKIIFKTK